MKPTDMLEVQWFTLLYCVPGVSDGGDKGSQPENALLTLTPHSLLLSRTTRDHDSVSIFYIGFMTA